MAKSYLNENALDFQTSAAIPLMLVITRFLDHEATQEFVVKFLTIALETLTSIEVSMN